nr:superoxide dismutase family protein [Bacillus piscicola]
MLAFITIILFVAVLTACGSENDNAEENNTGESETTEAPDAIPEAADDTEQAEENNQQEASMDETTDTEEPITVSLKNSDGEEIGTAELEETGEGVDIHLEAANLPENSKHGFHIHETGACEAPDFKSAGGHFNPADTDHGKESENGPHAGDLPNIETDENGEVTTDITAENVTLKPGEENSLLQDEGTALVIHSGPDDYQSQPSGDAGERIACGIISKS